MPEEDKKDAEMPPENDDEKSPFEDLPDKPQEKTDEEKENKKTPEELEAEIERERKEKQNLAEKLEKQNAARAEARREARKLEKELREIKQEAKKKANNNDEYADDTEKPEMAKDSPDEGTVEAVVSRKLYEKDVIQVIRSRASHRAEAEMVRAYVEKLGKGGLTTGNAEEDVERAYALLEQAKKQSTEGMPSPSSGGSSYTGTDMSKSKSSAIKMGKELFGHTEEDFKKYNPDEPITL